MNINESVKQKLNKKRQEHYQKYIEILNEHRKNKMIMNIDENMKQEIDIQIMITIIHIMMIIMIMIK
jgi:hypothetical protein